MLKDIAYSVLSDYILPCPFLCILPAPALPSAIPLISLINHLDKTFNINAGPCTFVKYTCKIYLQYTQVQLLIYSFGHIK